MLYIINGNIHFRNTDGAIWKEDENEASSVTLTATTSRLLTFLLDRHGEVASRDDILETVWTSHGLRSSNNSLNKYIADLRKIFNNLEMPDEVIITVPKIGFMFTREIDVEKEKFDYDYEQPAAEKGLGREEITDHKSAAGKNRSKKWMLIAFGVGGLGLAPILLSKALVDFKFTGLNTVSQSSYYFLGKVKECEIHTLKQSSTEMTATKLTIAKKIITMTGLNCNSSTKIFYQPSDPVVYGYPGRIFIAHCTLNKDSPQEFAACENYYGANYTNE